MQRTRCPLIAECQSDGRCLRDIKKLEMYYLYSVQRNRLGGRKHQRSADLEPLASPHIPLQFTLTSKSLLLLTVLITTATVSMMMIQECARKPDTGLLPLVLLYSRPAATRLSYQPLP